jgi:hypothetical protein
MARSTLYSIRHEWSAGKSLEQETTHNKAAKAYKHAANRNGSDAIRICHCVRRRQIVEAKRAIAVANECLKNWNYDNYSSTHPSV